MQYRARVIADPDTKVPDRVGVPVTDAVDGDDLADGPLHLPELGKEEPEAGLGSDRVLSEHLFLGGEKI